MINKIKRCFIFCLALILFITCKKDKGDLAVNGTLRDDSGFESCGWRIYLDNSAEFIHKMKNKNQTEIYSIIKPENLSDFKIELKDGLRLKFSYIIDTNGEISGTCGTLPAIIKHIENN